MINLSIWLWIWIVLIAIIKVLNIICGFAYKKKFVDLHTVLNKITGLLLFLLPITLKFIEPTYSCATVCTIATFAAIQESYYIIKVLNIDNYIDYNGRNLRYCRFLVFPTK